jgi:hypothetical protein
MGGVSDEQKCTTRTHRITWACGEVRIFAHNCRDAKEFRELTAYLWEKYGEPEKVELLGRGVVG